mmetsp:Transcript_32934/g.76944  ORF Transcript_32934/g.76944 Transcript_32934/m.76944 type:complete len:205 (+) Transcript_32934:1130-1744(+)
MKHFFRSSTSSRPLDITSSRWRFCPSVPRFSFSSARMPSRCDLKSKPPCSIIVSTLRMAEVRPAASSWHLRSASLLTASALSARFSLSVSIASLPLVASTLFSLSLCTALMRAFRLPCSIRVARLPPSPRSRPSRSFFSSMAASSRAAEASACSLSPLAFARRSLSWSARAYSSRRETTLSLCLRSSLLSLWISAGSFLSSMSS